MTIFISYCYYDNHKLSDIKQQTFITLQFWKGEIQISFTGLQLRFHQACIVSGGSREETISLNFQASTVACTSSIFQASGVAASLLSDSCFCPYIFSLNLILLPPSYKNPVLLIRLTCIIWGTLLILSTLT